MTLTLSCRILLRSPVFETMRSVLDRHLLSESLEIALNNSQWEIIANNGEECDRTGRGVCPSASQIVVFEENRSRRRSQHGPKSVVCLEGGADHRSDAASDPGAAAVDPGGKRRAR